MEDASTTRPRIYHSTRCQHSKVLLDTIKKAPQLRSAFLLIDVDLMPAQHRQKLSYVPTLVLSDGSVMVGAQAVQWASKYVVEDSSSKTAGGGGGASSNDDYEEYLLYDRTPYSNLNDPPETSFAVVRQGGYDYF